MGDNTGIEWTDASWNPVVGCTIVSPGCTHCYAMGQAARQIRCAEGLGRSTHYAGTVETVKGKPVWTGKLALAPESILMQPLRWKAPRKIFVNSMGDLFHEDVPDAWIDRVFAVMALSPQHSYQILTKRSARMRDYLASRRILAICIEIEKLGELWPSGKMRRVTRGDILQCNAWAAAGNLRDGIGNPTWPLRNVWLGVSAEDQRRADERIPDLLATPAAIRFVSAEPLLGPINFARLQPDGIKFTLNALTGEGRHLLGFTGQTNKLDWIIVGGESGPKARPMSIQWAREVRDQCSSAGVAFFFKQWGEWSPAGSQRSETPGRFAFGDYEHDRGHMVQIDHYPRQFTKFGARSVLERVGKARAGRLLDGVEHNAMPEIRHG